MTDSRTQRHRRSLRLKGYDYSQAGAYFVTICTQNRKCVFGTPADGRIELNDAGHIVHKAWGELPTRFSHVYVDAFVAMPNHIHGIILVGAQFIAPDTRRLCRDRIEQGAINRTPTLGEIVRVYKAISTRMIRQTANSTFAWQRNYYEHVIRNEKSLNRVKQYILDTRRAGNSIAKIPAAKNPEPKNVWRL